MGFRFTIGRKIMLGFSTLILLTLLAFGLTMITLKRSREINEKITNLYTPSVDALQDMNLLLVRSKMMVANWVNIQGPSQDKGKLDTLIRFEYPTLKKRIEGLYVDWSKPDKDSIINIFRQSDTLWTLHDSVMHQLNGFQKYEDAIVLFQMKNMVIDEDGEVTVRTRKISRMLDHLIERQNQAAVDKSKEMLGSFDALQLVVLILGIGLPVGGVIISLFTTRTITRPVYELKATLLQMTRGVLPHEPIRKRNDEIGDMSGALNNLVDSLKLTTEFANEVGSGNFDSYFKPLSEEDTLGHALMKMRVDLRENERILEAKVIERTEEVVRQKEEIEIQNRQLEVLYKHITDSIRYAKRLQEAILPPMPVVKRLLPESFILYKPKDIVSGDFYWLVGKGDRVMVAAVDCTGHGVPGAFMSLVANNMLNQIAKENEVETASAVLDELNLLAGKTINQSTEESAAVRDGMDMTLCIFDPKTRTLDFAGANNPLYLFRKNQFTEIKADKMPIGYLEDGVSKRFTNHRLQLEAGDMIYIFSDGYADQFGGPKGKKFMVNQFRNMLSQIHTLPMDEQKRTLDSTIETWRGNLEQVDDILVIGFRIS